MKEIGMATRTALGVAILVVGWAAYTFIIPELSTKPCTPKAAEATLVNLLKQGIRGVHHPPSLSNLLWVRVGPQWYNLSKKEKAFIDNLVRCAATTIDSQGQPTWRAAYYDYETGQLVAITSRQHGFRLENP